MAHSLSIGTVLPPCKGFADRRNVLSVEASEPNPRSERHQQHEQRRAYRWGKEDGYCMVDGQKVPIQRTRVRGGDNREQRLGSFELFQRDGPLQQGVWDKMMRGLSTRNYSAVVKDFQSAYGIEKSR